MHLKSYGLFLLATFAILACHRNSDSTGAAGKGKATIELRYNGQHQFQSPATFTMLLLDSPVDGASSVLSAPSFPVMQLPLTVPWALEIPAHRNQFSIQGYLESQSTETKFVTIKSGFKIESKPEIFFQIAKDLGDGFSRDEQNVFYNSTALPECNPGTFAILDRLYRYARDERNIYLAADRLNTNPASFQLLDKGYARDESSVWYHTSPSKLAEADSRTFQVYSETFYAHDISRVFYEGRVVSGARAASFIPLRAWFGKDDAQVYYSGVPVAGADAASFSMLGNSELYAADRNAAYFQNFKLPGVNPTLFKVLATDVKNRPVFPALATDGSKVFYLGKSIADVDAPTFEVLYSVQGGAIASRDKNRFYVNDQPTKVLPPEPNN